MVDSTLLRVSMNLSEAVRIMGEGPSELGSGAESHRSTRATIPGPLQSDGQNMATILNLFQSLIHEDEDKEDKPSNQTINNITEQGLMAMFGHGLAAYISVLDRERLRKLTTRILSDTTLWLCRLFRYENASAYLHEDDRDGLVKVCRLVIHARYEEYASEGYAALSAKQPVIYHSASGRPGLGQHLCSQLGLPLSSLCTVPCNTVFGSQHQMDVALLEKLIKEDVDTGKLPLLLIANAGTPGAGHTDKLGRLKDLCDQYSMWLHVEGVNLATLALGQVSSSILAAARCDSMTLTPGQWLGLPAVTAATLYRHEDPALSLAAGLTSSKPVAKLRALPLWLSLQCLGHNGIVEKIHHATALSHQLLQKLKALTSIKTSVEDELSSPVVLFKFSQDMSAASSGGSVEGYCAGEKEVLDTFNKWLGEQLLQSVPTSGVDVVELEDEGTCVRFSPLLTAAVLGTQQEDVEKLVEKLSDLLPVMSSTMCLRQDFREEVHRYSPSLVYVDDLNWPGLGVVRYELQTDDTDESKKKQQLRKVNAELLKKLQELETDIVFSTGPEFGAEKDCVFVGMVAEDVDVAELVDTIANFGRDIEESGRLLENMTEVVRKGIIEAEQQLLKANEEKIMEEGLMRQLPLVGSVLNWFSPIQSSVKGRTFNLASASLDSTELTYSTKAQAGRQAQQDTPSSSAKRLSGQRLFRRSARGSRSLSESSSVEQPEEGAAEESPSHSSSGGGVRPGDSPPSSEGDSQPVGGTMQQTVQEAGEQGDAQVEVDEASELRQTEDQGAEPGLR